jgi:hypothetical protein
LNSRKFIGIAQNGTVQNQDGLKFGPLNKHFFLP